VLRFLIIILAVVMIIPRIIEPTFENLVAVLGALGLALGFAFKDYVSSLIAGVVTLYEIPYRVGDWIEIDGAYGEVKSINMRTVEIVTRKPCQKCSYGRGADQSLFKSGKPGTGSCKRRTLGHPVPHPGVSGISGRSV
jgi:small conductance mechanosensitive channel